MLLREHSSCLCRGENGKSFCLAELWPALIVRIHWDFTINAVHAFQNTKKNYFGFTHAPLKFISAPRKDKLMTADDSIKCRCANSGMTDQVGSFQNRAVVCKRFLLSSSPPACSFTCVIFRAVFDSCSSFFAPSKPHRNACYAGYILCNFSRNKRSQINWKINKVSEHKREADGDKKRCSPWIWLISIYLLLFIPFDLRVAEQEWLLVYSVRVDLSVSIYWLFFYLHVFVNFVFLL